MDDRKVALAAVAHPDDIEFMMAGTMLLLKEAGWQIHFWNLATGSCGTNVHPRERIVGMRREEAAEAAAGAGAVYHEALFDDLAVFYDKPSLAAVSAVVREVAPSVILTHAPRDYMEDHQNVCRLIVSAAFSRGMRNYETSPATPPCEGPVRVYHALPHGLCDGLGAPVAPDLFIDIEPVLATKKKLLACHRSQEAWLDASQSMNAYVEEMEQLCRSMGAMSQRYAAAEAFLVHSHLGFCPLGFNPLREVLSTFCRTK